MGINFLIFLAMIFVAGASSASVVIIMKKYGLFDWYGIHRKLWMPEPCVFCAGFWISLLFVAGYSHVFDLNFWYIYVAAFPAASISLKLST